jgi:hypothetical protein
LDSSMLLPSASSSDAASPYGRFSSTRLMRVKLAHDCCCSPGSTTCRPRHRQWAQEGFKQRHSMQHRTNIGKRARCWCMMSQSASQCGHSILQPMLSVVDVCIGCMPHCLTHNTADSAYIVWHIRPRH